MAPTIVAHGCDDGPESPLVRRCLFGSSTAGLSELAPTFERGSSEAESTVLWGTQVQESGPDGESVRAQRKRVCMRPMHQAPAQPAIIIVPPTSSVTATVSTFCSVDDDELRRESAPQPQPIAPPLSLPARVDQTCISADNQDQTNLAPFDPTTDRRISGIEMFSDGAFRILKADVFGNGVRGKGSPPPVRGRKSVGVCSPAVAGQLVEYVDDFGKTRLGFLPPFVLTRRGGRSAQSFAALEGN